MSSVVASEPGGMASMHDRPDAPCFMASSTSFFISSSCVGVGRACELPITHFQMVPRPTKEATLDETPDLSTVPKYSPKVFQRTVLPPAFTLGGVSLPR